MGRLKLTTDAGDWSTLPRRFRLAFISLLVGASVVGIAAGLGLLSVAAAVIVLAGLGIAWTLFFDRRRRWWPDEPSMPSDPIGQGVRSKLMLFVAIGAGVAALVAVGALPA